MSEPKVFDYNNPTEFLNASLQAAQATNPRFSLRSWAKQLGLGHVAMLSMVLNGKRKLLPSLSSRVTKQYLRAGRFSENEARYFDLLVLFAAASSPEEKAFYERLLASLRPDRSFSTLDLDRFRLVADWYHLAIVEMTELKDFKSDSRWIRLRLGSNVSEKQVQEAIERLIRMGLLHREPNGRLRKSIAHYATPTDTSSEAIRTYHAQMIQKALVALENQSLDERDITGGIFTIERAKIPQAKAMIREFRKRFAEFVETPQGDAVYQINVQFFNALGDVKNVRKMH